MLTFAVVVARRGHAIPQGARAALDDPDLPEVPYVPWRHWRWDAPTGTVAVAAWEDGAEDPTIGSRWHAGAEGICAFTGHTWPRPGPWPGQGSWASQLAAHLRADPLPGAVDGLLGTFTALALDADGAGWVAADALGLGLTFLAEAPTHTVLASRDAVAARLAARPGSRPPRDPLGAGWLAYSVHLHGLATGFEGVRALAPEEVAVVDPELGAGVRVRAPVWGPAGGGELDALVEELHRDVASGVAAAAAMPVEQLANITGGRDSRAVVAVLLAEGRAGAFDYRVAGAPDLPDVVIARRIAELTGLPLRVNVPAPGLRSWQSARAVALGPLDRAGELRLAAGSASGTRNVLDQEPSCPPLGHAVLLSGLGGELLRTNYAGATGLRSTDDIAGFVTHNLKHGIAGILRPDVQQHYERELQALVQEVTVDDPRDAIDAVYLRHRLRRWFAFSREFGAVSQLYPLCSPAGVRAAAAIGAAARHGERLHHELIRRCAPQLLDVPFAKGAWPPWPPPEAARAWSPVPASPWRRPGDAGPVRTVRLEARLAREAADVELMGRYLLDAGPSAVGELLDRRAVEDRLARFGDLIDIAKRQLYGALTAAIWLSGDELVYRGSTR